MNTTNKSKNDVQLTIAPSKDPQETVATPESFKNFLTTATTATPFNNFYMGSTTSDYDTHKKSHG
jgi:hypothetical protein